MVTPQGISVAIVDDDPSLCRSLARLLKASGFEATTFLSAETFLERDTRDFDCLVLDIQLGGMSGLDLGRQLATDGSKVPVIYLTALDELEFRQQAMEAGCHAYFRKSDSGSTILSSIRGITSLRRISPSQPIIAVDSRTPPSP